MNALNDQDGRIVKEAWTVGQGWRIAGDATSRVVFRRSYHGDRDEHWLHMEEIATGKVVEIYNVRHCERIEFA